MNIRQEYLIIQTKYFEGHIYILGQNLNSHILSGEYISVDVKKRPS
jgi:hypothetical protein